ncbi:unnamed protein product [Linum tenue]|uniref:FHA domain-containing protein n=1 Tax=Linum tenue TaxID=586396 RepID=A0AAV0KCX8_9ROSI|nr:unnamed protein product [Linum tenue]
MEIEGDDGSKTELHRGSATVLGRGNGFETYDRTVSRRHIEFRLDGANRGGEYPAPAGGNHSQPLPRVSFLVIGKNPVCVRTDGEEKLFKKSDRGQLVAGDCFCISTQPPVWFRLRTVGRAEARDIESDAGYGNETEKESEDEENFDISLVDPVKEFGLLVIGREFERYPKGRVRNAKEWDWFLDETEGVSEDENEGGRRGRRKKKKNGMDDEWRGESEDEEKEIGAETTTNRRKKDGGGGKYTTRAQDKKRKKERDGEEKKVGGGKKRKISEVDEEKEEDEDDETLGGFIVDEEELDDEGEEESEGEEEEFMDDDEEEDEEE